MSKIIRFPKQDSDAFPPNKTHDMPGIITKHALYYSFVRMKATLLNLGEKGNFQEAIAATCVIQWAIDELRISEIYGKQDLDHFNKIAEIVNLTGTYVQYRYRQHTNNSDAEAMTPN